MRSTWKAVRFVWRAQWSWVILTAIVLGDTLFWDLAPNGGRLPPLVFPGLRPEARSRWGPLHDFTAYALRPEADGSRYFNYSRSDGTDPERAEYEITGRWSVGYDGLWAPWLRYEWASFYVRNTLTGNRPRIGEVQDLLNDCLQWHLKQPLLDPHERRARALLVSRGPSGQEVLHVVWWGVLHDAFMLPASIMWVSMTLVRGARLPVIVRAWWRRRATMRRGRCRKCRYPVAGLTGDCCPECGTPLRRDQRKE